MSVEAQVASCYQRLQGDDRADREAAKAQIILLLLPIAGQHVGHFLKSNEGAKYRYLKDDLEGRAREKLVTEVEAMARGKRMMDGSKVAHYVKKAIITAIQRYAREDDTIRVPCTTRMRGIRRAPSVLPEAVTVLDDVPEPTYESPEGVIDLWDAIQATCHNEQERWIVNHRAAGYSTHEIAAELGITHKHVEALLRNLRMRVLAELAG